MSEGDHTHGLIIGGSDNGVISIWSAQKIIEYVGLGGRGGC